MYVVVGLGNPGKQYENTRHNVGFNVIDILAKEYDISVTKIKHKALIGEGRIGSEKVLLVKPQTYMNLSGESIIEAIKFYKIDTNKIIVIYDDIDVKPGKIKIRKKGGPGSHNGMKSVINSLGSQEFSRIRVGIGTPEHKNDMINYVIGKVPKEELEQLDEGTSTAKEAVTEIIKNGIDIAMNKFN